MQPKLGYWDCQARAGYIRLLLAYARVDYQDKRYTFGKREEWQADKAKLAGEGADFPNLPYWVDGEVKLTQSHAILRYLGRKYGLDGRNPKELTRMDLAENEAYDVYHSLIMAAMTDAMAPGAEPKYPKMREDLLKSIPGRLAQFDKFIGKGPWVCGDRLTYVDFRLYSALNLARLFEASLLTKTPNLAAYVKRFEELPTIKAYMASDAFRKIPENPSFAAFGGQLPK